MFFQIVDCAIYVGYMCQLRAVERKPELFAEKLGPRRRLCKSPHYIFSIKISITGARENSESGRILSPYFPIPSTCLSNLLTSAAKSRCVSPTHFVLTTKSIGRTYLLFSGATLRLFNNYIIFCPELHAAFLPLNLPVAVLK